MEHAKLTVGTHALRLLVCESGFERLRGLLGRPEPEPSVALLIDPCWAVHTFGMGHAIDVVFCDAQWRVLRTVEALRPRRVAWERGATRVLELRARSARALGFAPGVRLMPEPRVRARTALHAGDEAHTISTPVRALAGLAVVTVCALFLLGGCASTRTTPLAPEAQAAQPALEELRMQADIDYRSRAWSLADADLRVLLRHEPREAEHWRRLGVVLLNTGRAREAVEALEAAVRLGATDARLLQNLALAHLRAGCDRLEEAASLTRAGGSRHTSAGNDVDASVGTSSAASVASEALRADSIAPPHALRAVADQVRRFLPREPSGAHRGARP